MPHPTRAALAELVAVYVAHCEKIYPSREWMNVRAALARLVTSTKTLRKRDIRNALDILELERELSVNYRRQVWQRWQRFIRWAVEHEHAPALLIFELSAFRPRFQAKPTDDEPHQDKPTFNIADFRNALPFVTRTTRDVLIVLACTGARPSDILRLQTRDIDVELRIAQPGKHKTAHRGRSRVIPLPPPAWLIIEQRLQPFCPADWLFPAARNLRTCAKTDVIAQNLRRAQKRHRLPSWSLYDLRRHAARFTRSNASLDEAQALLGHASIRTTELYAPRRTQLAEHAANLLSKEVLP